LEQRNDAIHSQLKDLLADSKQVSAALLPAAITFLFAVSFMLLYPDPHWIRVRIRKADLDPGAWKLTKIKQ
jgi:hypothetical protein